MCVWRSVGGGERPGRTGGVGAGAAPAVPSAHMHGACLLAPSPLTGGRGDQRLLDIQHALLASIRLEGGGGANLAGAARLHARAAWRGWGVGGGGAGMARGVGATCRGRSVSRSPGRPCSRARSDCLHPPVSATMLALTARMYATVRNCTGGGQGVRG